MAILLAASAHAQDMPLRLFQDEGAFQPRNLIQGSGARAWGMGGAFLARADDATAVSWNPAGLSYLRRPELSLVGVGTRHHVLDYKSTGELNSDDRARGETPEFVSLAYPFEIGGSTGAVQLSFQRVISFRHDRTIERNELRIEIDSSGGFDTLSLGVGLHVGPNLRLGASLNRWRNGHEQRLERLVRRRVQQHLDFDLSGWNANLGVIWSPWEALNIGVVGKTSFDGGVSMSRARTDFISQPVGSDIVTTNAWRSDDVVLEFPGSLGLGLSWRPRSTLTISADYTRTYWSGSRLLNFFTLAPAPEEGPKPEPLRGTEDFYPVLPYPAIDSPQEDTVQLRGGLEYVFLAGRFKLPVRLGAFSDRQHFLPGEGDLRRTAPPIFAGLTAGTGIILGPVLFDVAYVRETGSFSDPQGDRTEVSDHRVFVSLIYRRGGQP